MEAEPLDNTASLLATELNVERKRSAGGEFRLAADQFVDSPLNRYKREFPARMHKSKKSQRIIRQVGVQAYRDSSTASIQTG